MHQQQYPLRFGVVLACEESQSLAEHNLSQLSRREVMAAGGGKESSSLMGEDDDLLASSLATSIDVCRLFGHAKEHHGAPAATGFLFSLAQMLTAQSQQGS